MSSLWKELDASLSSPVHASLSALVSRRSCRSLKTRMNLLFFIAFMGRIRILLLFHSCNMNRYLLPLFGNTGDFTVRCVTIFLLWLMILVNTVSVRCAIGVDGERITRFRYWLIKDVLDRTD